MRAEHVLLMERLQQQAPAAAHEVWALIEELRRMNAREAHVLGAAQRAHDLLLAVTRAQCGADGGWIVPHAGTPWGDVCEHLADMRYLQRADGARYRLTD